MSPLVRGTVYDMFLNSFRNLPCLGNLAKSLVSVAL